MSKKLLLDMIERAAWTFAEAFLAVYVITDVSSAKTAAVAGAGAALAVVKGFVASHVGESGTAATLPAPVKGD